MIYTNDNRYDINIRDSVKVKSKWDRPKPAEIVEIYQTEYKLFLKVRWKDVVGKHFQEFYPYLDIAKISGEPYDTFKAVSGWFDATDCNGKATCTGNSNIWVELGV